MSHLNSNETHTESGYTAVEIKSVENQSEPAKKSPLKRIGSAIQRNWEDNGRFKFIITAVGIFVSYLYVGILQEKIMRGCYGDDVNKDCRNGEKFKYAVTLVAAQSLFAFTIISILNVIKPEKKDRTHFGYYACGAAANTLAMVSSNMALRWVTYPMQVIFKSAKPISVMVSGLLICKRYTIQRYIFVLIIVAGVIVFKLFESKEGKTVKKTQQDDKTALDQWFGIALLIFSLSMDGVLGAFQDKIRDVFSPTFRQMMLSMNAWCIAILSVIVIVTGEIAEIIAFANRHPNIIWHLCTLGLAGAIGQLFIFTMVSSFGSLACCVTTTVRKFFSVAFSIVFFGNPSTPIQWCGAVLVFAGLLADAAFGKSKTNKKTDEKDAKEMEIISEKVGSPMEQPVIISKNKDSQPV